MIYDFLKTLIEIEPLDRDEFLRVKETLTRIGIVGKNIDDSKPILWQSVYLLHKQGRFYLPHFKQLFLLDGRGRKTHFTKEDDYRTKAIALKLQVWKLVTLKTVFDAPPPVNFTVVTFINKKDWELKSKYSIGKQKRGSENEKI